MEGFACSRSAASKSLHITLYITVGVGLAPTQAVGNPNLFNQHSIPKTEEAIAFANSFLVGLFDQVLAGKGAYEQQ